MRKNISSPYEPKNFEDRFISLKEVTTKIGYSRASTYRLMANPESGFPTGIKLSPKKRVWRLSTILAWMEAQELKAANDPIYREGV